MEQLEWKYFVFSFEADYTEDWAALAVCKVTKWQLVEVFHPCDNTWSVLLLNIWERESKKAIEFLKENWVREILSTWETWNPEEQDILWKKMSWYDDEDNWGWYSWIYDQDWYRTQRFRNEWIELKLFNHEANQVDEW